MKLSRCVEHLGIYIVFKGCYISVQILELSTVEKVIRVHSSLTIYSIWLKLRRYTDRLKKKTHTKNTQLLDNNSNFCFINRHKLIVFISCERLSNC